MKKKFVLVLLCLVAHFSSLAVWGQSTYVVDRLTDMGEGSGLRGDLRYCLTNATSGEDVITFEGTSDAWHAPGVRFKREADAWKLWCETLVPSTGPDAQGG